MWRAFLVPLVLPPFFIALVLLGVWRNGHGARAPIALTERDVTLDAGTDARSGATAWINWSDPADDGWLSPAQIEGLGFDLGGDAARLAAAPPASRQLPRRAYVVLHLAPERQSRSRLVPVDAGLDRDRLLAAYPDGRTHLVSAAVIGLRRSGPPPSARVVAYLATLDPRGLHVPTDLLAPLTAAPAGGSFTLLVRYGGRLEPTIVAVR